jgi:hypothetical protein
MKLAGLLPQKLLEKVLGKMAKTLITGTQGVQYKNALEGV